MKRTIFTAYLAIIIVMSISACAAHILGMGNVDNGNNDNGTEIRYYGNYVSQYNHNIFFAVSAEEIPEATKECDFSKTENLKDAFVKLEKDEKSFTMTMTFLDGSACASSLAIVDKTVTISGKSFPIYYDDESFAISTATQTGFYLWIADGTFIYMLPEGAEYDAIVKDITSQLMTLVDSKTVAIYALNGTPCAKKYGADTFAAGVNFENYGFLSCKGDKICPVRTKDGNIKISIYRNKADGKICYTEFTTDGTGAITIPNFPKAGESKVFIPKLGFYDAYRDKADLTPFSLWSE